MKKEKKFSKIMISLPTDLWIKAKKRSIDEGVTLSGLLSVLLEKYLEVKKNGD